MKRLKKVKFRRRCCFVLAETGHCFKVVRIGFFGAAVMSIRKDQAKVWRGEIGARLESHVQKFCAEYESARTEKICAVYVAHKRAAGAKWADILFMLPYVRAEALKVVYTDVPDDVKLIDQLINRFL